MYKMIFYYFSFRLLLTTISLEFGGPQEVEINNLIQSKKITERVIPSSSIVAYYFVEFEYFVGC